MDSSLQQTLRSLCSNTEWKYAVFWKLNHGSRMVLTLEDAYYENHEQSNHPEVKGVGKAPANLHGGCYTHDPLGLAVANMSYHVYSLGEGIVGQVALSGKHQWVFPEYFNYTHSSFELYSGWESQISAGIKTVLVVAVGPRGVVQLGSLYKVDEDVNLVTHIRHLFLALKDPLAECSLASSTCLLDLPSECLNVEAVLACSEDLDKAVDRRESNVLFQRANERTSTVTCTFPLSHLQTEKAVEVSDEHGAVQVSMSGSCKGAKCGFPVDWADSQRENQVGTGIMGNALYDGETSCCGDSRRGSYPSLYPNPRNNVLNNACLSAFATEADTYATHKSSLYVDSAVYDALKVDTQCFYQNEVLQVSDCQGNKCMKGSKHTLEGKNELSVGALNTSMSSFAGSELLEALGPAFSKGSTTCGEQVSSETGATIRLTEDMSNSRLTFDSGVENLLDAVVANVCHSDGNNKHELSLSRSVQSLLTVVEMAEPSNHEKHIIGNSVGSRTNQPHLAEEKTPQNPSDIGGALSSIAFSSTCPSSSNEQFQSSLEMPKKNKKRAKPGENSRPRPRDRQLIQDRIKELRELVPNGSKCSIDSLLERTIKHMLFLQNVTKHADKLSKCAGSKMQHTEHGILGSTNAEQGSSWAVEVGGHLQVCSIMVENLNKQGLMLIEMLCEECSHFLEIANVIRSLDLIILRGITETHGEKAWICFVVEGQNNKVMHRMDILWSLVQIFQPKATEKQ